MYEDRNLKNRNKLTTMQLGDIFTSLCCTFSNEVLRVNSEQIEAIKSRILVRQAMYEDSRFESSNRTSLELENTKKYLGCHKELNSENPMLINHQESANKTISEKDYFQGLREHTKNIANLNQYNLENLIQGRYKTYFWSPLRGFTQIENHGVDTTVIPIGEYGCGCALRMLYTTNILANLCVHFIYQEAASAETENWEIISCETATGRQKKRAQDELKLCPHENEVMSLEEYHSLLRKAQAISVLDSFKEGIQSLQSAISSLMAQRLEDYPSAESLLEAILDAELPLEFSRIVPFGYTLPVTRNGRFFPEILEVYRQKDLAPDVKISLKFKKMSRFLKEEYLAKKVYLDSQHNPGFLGTGCPLSFQKSEFADTGIGYVMKAYRHVFKLVKIDFEKQG